jgi:hypothetical protein
MKMKSNSILAEKEMQAAKETMEGFLMAYLQKTLLFTMQEIQNL